MRAHILQHVPFEGIGSIEHWLNGRGASVSWTRFFESTELPTLETFDLIIALGGPMSVNDEADLPWLRAEKRFIAAAIEARKAVLGICLGAQLIASALGAPVYPNTEKEIGWFPIAAEPHRPGCFRFPDTVRVFHWHGETFALPTGAARLASSAVCRNQAFQIGTRVLGLQFHLETTPESADAIISNCNHDLVPERFIQTESALRATPPSAYREINFLMNEVLEYLVRPDG